MPFPLFIVFEPPIPLIPTTANSIRDSYTDAGIQVFQVNCRTDDFHLPAQSSEIKRFASAFPLPQLTNNVHQVLIVFL